MKYNTKSYQFSNDEPNINNNSTNSPADEKRLLLKKSSYTKQNRKRVEKFRQPVSAKGYATVSEGIGPGISVAPASASGYPVTERITQGVGRPAQLQAIGPGVGNNLITESIGPGISVAPASAKGYATVSEGIGPGISIARPAQLEEMPTTARNILACPVPSHEGFIQEYASPGGEYSFFEIQGRIPGVLGGYDSSMGRPQVFPKQSMFEESNLISVGNFNQKATTGISQEQYVKQNPVIDFRTTVGGKTFNMKVAQLYRPKLGEWDVLGFKILTGRYPGKTQEYGYIQWFKDDFNCGISDVYQFRLGPQDISQEYLDKLPKDSCPPCAACPPCQICPVCPDIPLTNTYDDESGTEDEEEEIDEDMYGDDVSSAGIGPASALASSGMGSSSSCPKHCTNPHSDGWWRNTKQILWEDSDHASFTAEYMKEGIKKYENKEIDYIIKNIEATYSIETALALSKGLLEDRHIEHANIKAVYDSFREMKGETEDKLKLSSKSIIREHWLRKLMKNLANEYMRHYEIELEEGEETLEKAWNDVLSQHPYEVKKSGVEAVIKHTTEKANAIFGLLSEHLDVLNIIWDSQPNGSTLYNTLILEPFVKSELDKYKIRMLEKYGLDAAPVPSEGVGEAGRGLEEGSASSGVGPPSGPFGGMTFKKEEMLFFKRHAKKVMVAIIKDTPFPSEVIREIKSKLNAEGAPDNFVEQHIGAINKQLNSLAGDNAPVIDINTSKMSELFHAYSILSKNSKFRDIMNQVMAYLAIHMTGEEEWIVEQFKEIQKSRYKDTKIVKFAVQLIKKLGNTIETEQKIEQTIELDVEQVEKIGEAINETETPPEDLEKELESAREEVTQQCENKIDGLNAQIEDLRTELQQEKDKIKGKDNMIKYGAIGAGVVIVLLILFLLMK